MQRNPQDSKNTRFLWLGGLALAAVSAAAAISLCSMRVDLRKQEVLESYGSSVSAWLEGTASSVALWEDEQRALRLDPAACNCEACADLGAATLDHGFCVSADDSVARACHSEVGDISAAIGEHLLVSRLNMRVRAEHYGNSAVEVTRKRDLLGGRLCVNVENCEIIVARLALKYAVNGGKRAG